MHISAELLALIATLAIVFFIWQRRAYSYWQRHGIKHIKPTSIFGNFGNVFFAKSAFNVQIAKLHSEPGFEKEPLIGIYRLHRPALIIRDLELIKTVMIKKFNYFSNRAMQADMHHDPLGANNLFFSRNPQWRELRAKITPVFTSGKVKQMYPLMVEVGLELEAHLGTLPASAVVQVKDLCARFTTDLISTTAFGVKANAMREQNSEFFIANMGTFEISLKRGLEFMVLFMLPSLMSLLRVKIFSKSSSAFIRKSINYVLAEREKTGLRRNDLIDTLLNMKREAQQAGKPFTDKDMDVLVAQAAIFQTAGFETSASTLTFTLFELAHNLDIQQRLRNEIVDYYAEHQTFDYEGIQEKMPYMAQVINETLRKYPIVGYAERECTQPASGERFTLAPYHDYELPQGMPVYVATLAIQRDAQYWPDPECYDPERFAPANRANLNMDAYMPFGVGPHNCIGMRIGLLQAKLGLVHILRNYRVLKCDKTVNSITFSTLSAVLAAKDEVYLTFERC